jgi:hypothetical protein
MRSRRPPDCTRHRWTHRTSRGVPAWLRGMLIAPTRPPAPVSPDDLACRIGAAARGGRNLDVWRGELVSALTELQKRRQADANRTAGVARATAKRGQEHLVELRNEVEMAPHQRDEAMRAPRNAALLSLSSSWTNCARSWATRQLMAQAATPIPASINDDDQHCCLNASRADRDDYVGKHLQWQPSHRSDLARANGAHQSGAMSSRSSSSCWSRRISSRARADGRRR